MTQTIKTTLVLTMGAALIGGCKSDPASSGPDPETPSTQGMQLASVAPAAEGEAFWSPLDATPSPEGAQIYFTATVEDGPAVLSVASEGGAPEVLYAGEALAAPFGVVTSLDGRTLFVADSAVQAAADEEDSVDEGPVGGILRLSVSGGTPQMISGTEGTTPRALHVSSLDGQEVLHFTGSDPETGEAAVYRVASAGGAVTTVARGAPLGQPSGIVSGPDGKLYVADASATEEGAAALLVIDGGEVSTLAESLRLGFPAGITIDVEGTTVLASGLADDADQSVVHAIDLASGTRQAIDQGIGHNQESGGVHRAHDSNVFAWANSAGDERAPGGTVYVLKAAE